MSRGPGPRDNKLFAPSFLPKLSAAVVDLGVLLERRYAESASLKLVGDHFQLHKRQRTALMRSAAAPSKILAREAKRVTSVEGCTLAIDGFNLIILLEAALGGGLVLQCADGTYRDLSSIHGTYKMVEQTQDVLIWVGEWANEHGAACVHWWLDSPVSNSGKLASVLRGVAEERQWNWEVTVTPHVDRELSQSEDVVVTGDKIILNQCQQWANLGRSMIEQGEKESRLPNLWLVELPHEEHRRLLLEMQQPLAHVVEE
ncbi:MAG: DUF434 domain-containing protein [Deltaproteobacteria bacterium]|nr:MAG: DUF434 domain-containing protein [Deltaproteobacteria bacterium]